MMICDDFLDYINKSEKEYSIKIFTSDENKIMVTGTTENIKDIILNNRKPEF